MSEAFARFSDAFSLATFASKSRSWNRSSDKVAVCTKNGTVLHVRTDTTLVVVFFRTESGNEPVREWLKTSRSALERLLDPDNVSVTLLTLERAAKALGKSIRIELAA